MKVRKKPVIVEAWQLDSNTDDYPTWVHDALHDTGRLEYRNYRWEIATYEGVMVAFNGDYLVQGAEGELYPVRESVFEKTYEVVSDAS